MQPWRPSWCSPFPRNHRARPPAKEPQLTVQPSIFLLSWAKTIRPLAVIKTPTPIFSMSAELLPPSARMTVRNCNAFLTKGRSSNCISLHLVLFSGVCCCLLLCPFLAPTTPHPNKDFTYFQHLIHPMHLTSQFHQPMLFVIPINFLTS